MTFSEQLPSFREWGSHEFYVTAAASGKEAMDRAVKRLEPVSFVRLCSQIAVFLAAFTLALFVPAFTVEPSLVPLVKGCFLASATLFSFSLSFWFGNKVFKKKEVAA